MDDEQEPKLIDLDEFNSGYPLPEVPPEEIHHLLPVYPLLQYEVAVACVKMRSVGQPPEDATEFYKTAYQVGLELLSFIDLYCPGISAELEAFLDDGLR